MNLFDIIPSNFFNCLAGGGNQRIYADCFNVIYNQYEKEISYRIPRNAVRDAIAFFLSENKIVFEEDGEEAFSGHADMAAGILRRFCSVGWLEEETDDNTYEKQIMMTERGIMLAEFLERLKIPETDEYSGYIFQIYNIINNPELWKEHPYVNGLKSIFKNAKALANSLKKLSTFIKKIIEKMVVEESLESLTENLLDYFDGSFIREYARLTGQQNIHIYRGRIKKELNRIKTDDVLLEKLYTECGSEEFLKKEEALVYVTDMLQTALQFLTEDYDRIMRDIKHKINVYLQVAVGRARFLRNRDADDKGTVESLIKLLSQNEENLKDTIEPEVAAIFCMDRNEFLDLNSLRFPARVRTIKKATAADAEVMSGEAYEETRRRQEREAANPYSRKNMKAYLDMLTEERSVVYTEDMPLKSVPDMLCALSAVAYGDKNGYKVTPEEGYVENDALIIRRFNIRRK